MARHLRIVPRISRSFFITSCIVESQKYCAISKEIVFYLEMYHYFAAIIASHERKSINLRAQSMLKNHNKSLF
jgi:hypothetical protein